MRNTAIVSFVVLVSLCLMSCAFILPGSGGVMPGAIINITTVPGDLTDDVLYAAYPDSFTIIGKVEGTSGTVNILGLFSFGDGGYIAAIENAKASVGADGIINCIGDVRGESYFGILAQSTTVVQGYAIKRK